MALAVALIAAGLAQSHFTYTPNASICFKTIEQVASLSTAEEAPRALRRSFSPRHGRRILRPAVLHADAIRFAQPESDPGARRATPTPHLILSFPSSPLPLFALPRKGPLYPDSLLTTLNTTTLDEPRTGARSRSESKEI